MHGTDEFFPLDLPERVCQSGSVSNDVCREATYNEDLGVLQKTRLPVEAVVLDHVI
jgi:hypothetical protein